MRWGGAVLLLAAAAFAAPEEDISRIFREPSALPGKLSFDAYAKVLAAKGYPKPASSPDDMRSHVAGYLGGLLQAPCTVRRIRVAADGTTATAVVDHGGRLLRWFLVLDSGRWWYSDFEDVRRALRFSDWGELPGPLTEALDENAEAKEIIELLLHPPEGRRPPTVEAARLAALAHALWLVDRDREALKCCAEASAQCDAPVVELWRALAAFSADELQLAVTAALAYMEVVGEDAEACYELGRSLRWLDRRDEAVAAHLRGLKADPSEPDNVVGLFRALPDDRKKEAVEHFLKLDPLDEGFAYVAGRLSSSETWPALAALLDGYRPGHAADPNLARYDAVLLAGLGRHGEAAPRLLALLPKAGKDRAELATLYLTSMHALGRSLEGYERLAPGDRDLTWSALAKLLAEGRQGEMLEGLVAKRRGHPDGALPIWEIELRWIRQEYAEIDALAKKHAAAILSSEDEEAWRPADRRVRSLLRLGKAEEALALARDRKDPVLLFAVLAALGKKDEAAGVLKDAIAKGRERKEFERDEDAGPFLWDAAYPSERGK